MAKTDQFAVVIGHQPQIRFLDRLLNGPENGAVPGGDDDESAFGNGEGRHLV